MPTGLTGRRNNIAYVGVEAPQPPNMLEYPRNPRTTDVFEYFVGDYWINSDRNSVDFQSLWYYASRLQNVATWLRLTTGAGALLFLTPDVGGPVFPLAGNININGLNGITTTGNIAPASPHQITIGSSGGHNFLESVEGDDLVKVFPDNTGNINTRGGILLPNVITNIETFGNVGTFTEFFALKNSILQPPTNAAGDEGVYALGSTDYTTDRFLHNFGTDNTFVGYQSGNLTLTGTGGNSGVGTSVLSNLVNGTLNSALGLNAGTNYTGAETGNIIIGANALGRTGAGNNILIRTPSAVLADGQLNIFIGQMVGNTTYDITMAKTNIGIGSSCFNALTTGSQNVTVGPGNMQLLTTATANASLGQGAMQSITTGSNNTAMGFGALTMASTSSENVAIGTNCLDEVTTGVGRNTGVGTASGDNLSTGTHNLFLGFNSGLNYTTESSNICLMNFGTIADANTIRIGNPGSGDGQQDKCFIYGIRGVTTGVNDAVAVLVDSAGQLGTTSSSIRYKTNIRHMEDESEDIYKLTPVVFNWKEDHDDNDVYGLIAEDVEGKMPYLVAYGEDKQPFSVKYHELPVLLLNEIKKLKKEIDDLKLKCKL